MKRYLAAYGAWLAGVLTMAAIALAWYRQVEQIGWREVAARTAEPVETAGDGASPPGAE